MIVAVPLRSLEHIHQLLRCSDSASPFGIGLCVAEHSRPDLEPGTKKKDQKLPQILFADTRKGLPSTLYKSEYLNKAFCTKPYCLYNILSLCYGLYLGGIYDSVVV